MKRKTMVGAVVVVATLVLLALLVPLFLNAERFRPAIESRLKAALGREVRIGKLRFSLLAGGLGADDIAVADDPAFATQPFVTAKGLDVNVELLPMLLHREVHINSLTVRQPQVTLIRSGGRWNVSAMGAPAAPGGSGTPGGTSNPVLALTLKEFTLAGGQLTIQQPGSTAVFSDLNIKASNLSPGSVFPVSLDLKLPGNGKLSLQGKAGPMPAGNLAEMPVQAALKIENLDPAAYAGGNAGFGGSAALQAAFRCDGRVAHLEGSSSVKSLTLAKGGVPLPDPVASDFAADYDLTSESGTLTRADLRLGKSAVRMTGSFRTSGSTTELNLVLAAPAIEAADVERILKAMAVVLPGGTALQGGTASANLAISGPTNALVITGPLHVQNLTITGFNLGSNLKAVAALAGINTGPQTVVQSLDAKARVAPEGTRIDDLNVVVSGVGTLTGSGVIDARKNLDFHLVVRMNQSNSGLGGLMKRAGIANLMTVPVHVEGTTDHPRFMPDAGQLFRSQKGAASGQAQPRNPAGNVLNQLFKKKR